MLLPGACSFPLRPWALVMIFGSAADGAFVSGRRGFCRGGGPWICGCATGGSFLSVRVFGATGSPALIKISMSMAAVRQTATRMTMPRTVFFNSWKVPGLFFLAGFFVPVFLAVPGFFFVFVLIFFAALGTFLGAGAFLPPAFFVPSVDLVEAIYFTEHTVADENIKGAFYLDIFIEFFEFSIFWGFFFIYSPFLFGFKAVS